MKKAIITGCIALAAAGASYADAPAGTETWHELGTGLIRDDLLTALWFTENTPEFECLFMESDQVPGRYKLVNAYANHPWGSTDALLDHEHFFVLDASDPDHVFIEKGCLGMNYRMGDYHEYSIWSVADHEYNDIWGNWEDVEANAGRIWGTLRDGAVTFPRYQVLVYTYGQQDPDDPNSPFVHPDGGTPANERGLFRIKLPGAPTYDISAVYNGVTGTFPDATLNFSVTLGADVEYVRYGIIEGDNAAQLVAELEAGGGNMADRSQLGMFGVMDLQIPYEGDGYFTFVAVPFSAAGEPKAYAEEAFSVQIDESEWRKLGEASWTEHLLTDAEYLFYESYGIGGETLTCEVEGNRNQPGLIRLVNPFKTHPMASRQTYDYANNYYMEVAIIDNDHVRILEMPKCGLNLGYGEHWIWSRADRSMVRDGWTPEMVDMVDGTFGKLDPETREISMPKWSMLIEFTQAAPGTVYRTNGHGNFKIMLPESAVDFITAGVVAIDAEESDAPTEYYTLDGLKVEKPGKGLYIVRRGAKTAKVRF